MAGSKIWTIGQRTDILTIFPPLCRQPIYFTGTGWNVVGRTDPGAFNNLGSRVLISLEWVRTNSSNRIGSSQSLKRQAEPGLG
jgi:hypothetical protein